MGQHQPGETFSCLKHPCPGKGLGSGAVASDAAAIKTTLIEKQEVLYVDVRRVRDQGDTPVMGTAASAGGEAPGAGEAGLPQHPQEADGMSAGPARRGRRQALGEALAGL